MRDYLDARYVSGGLLHTLLEQSPAHARYQLDNRIDDPNETSETGVAIHDSLLEGVHRIVPCPFADWRKGDAKAMREAARAAGKIPLLEHKVAAVQAASAALEEHLLGSELGRAWAGPNEREVTVVWNEGSIPFKIRPDCLAGGYCINVKSTKGSAEPESWIRNALCAQGYDLSAILYERGLAAVGISVESVFAIVEQLPPHGCSIVGLSPAMREMAAAKVDRAIAAWQSCVQSGNWPCYPSRIAYAEPPAWMLAQEEERRLGMEYDREQERKGLQA